MAPEFLAESQGDDATYRLFTKSHAWLGIAFAWRKGQAFPSQEDVTLP